MLRIQGIDWVYSTDSPDPSIGDIPPSPTCSSFISSSNSPKNTHASISRTMDHTWCVIGKARQSQHSHYFFIAMILNRTTLILRHEHATRISNQSRIESPRNPWILCYWYISGFFPINGPYYTSKGLMVPTSHEPYHMAYKSTTITCIPLVPLFIGFIPIDYHL